MHSFPDIQQILLITDYVGYMPATVLGDEKTK